ncbi:MAG: hypothetical protein QXH42_05615 [Thermoplasmata archaeon]
MPQTAPPQASRVVRGPKKRPTVSVFGLRVKEASGAPIINST